MEARHTHADFDRLSWHDCHVWGLSFRVGDPHEDDWTSDLVLDIDFIVEWICGIKDEARFKVAPAMLAFHGVTDSRMTIDWGSAGFQMALHPLSIDRIERQAVVGQKVYLDRPYFSWRIRLNWPTGGEIAFGAFGFTQTLLAEPSVTAKQHLSFSERSRLITR